LLHSCEGYQQIFYVVKAIQVLHDKIDQTLLNKLHGPMHYKISVSCVYNEHVFYTLL